jgi:uncharacterized protein (TIGR03000 family)
MHYRRLLMALAGALVTAVSPLAVHPALGQGAANFYYETYLFGYNPGYYARRYVVLPAFVMPSKMAPASMPYVYYMPAPAAGPPKSNRAPPVEVRVLFGAATPAPAAALAQIDLQVPADAQVWFDGEKTTQTGSPRQFVSPPLTPGRAYTYEVRAAWKEGGREVMESRRLSVRAGDHLTASFPAAQAKPIVRNTGKAGFRVIPNVRW